MRKYIISEIASIREALVAINSITHDGESLIVVNVDQQMVAWWAHSLMVTSAEDLSLGQN